VNFVLVFAAKLEKYLEIHFKGIKKRNQELTAQ
jgi:hypothetical protein